MGLEERETEAPSIRAWTRVGTLRQSWEKMSAKKVISSDGEHYWQSIRMMKDGRNQSTN